MIYLSDNLKNKIDILRSDVNNLLENFENNIPPLNTPEGPIEATRADLEAILVLIEIIDQQGSLEGYKPLEPEKEILKKYNIIRKETIF